MKKPAPRPAPPRPPYTIRTAATYLSLSRRTIERLVAEGVLRKSTVVKGKILIPAADVENLVESTC